MKNCFRFFLILCTLVSFSCTKKHRENEILIGVVGSLTGADASFGVSMKEGILLALEQINEKGGVKGKVFRAKIVDDQSKSEEAASAVSKLIAEDSVLAILGEVASSRSLAMAPIAQSNKVPMITPASINPRVTQVGDYVFRVCFVDSFESYVGAVFARKTLHAKKAAILRDVKTDYSVGLADAFKENFVKQGGEIVADLAYSSGDVDFNSQLVTIKNKDPDVIFLPGYYTDVGLIARQRKALQIRAPLLGTDGWDSEKLIAIGGDALNGSYFSNFFTADPNNPKNVAFQKDYKEKFKKEPDGNAFLGYDAMMLLANALERGNEISRVELKRALAETKGFAGITGTITMNENRDAIKPAAVIEIRDQAYRLKEVIKP
ncbi:MAG: ABC transporter substrate-binding protein [Bacteriovoracia bacterium]